MIEDKIQKNIEIAPLTTFKVGGFAKYFIEVSEENELLEAVAWAKRKQKPFFVLGGGSNLLINDGELDLLFIRMANNQAKAMPPRIYLGAGTTLASALSLAKRESLTGLEWGFGIPLATMGGCVRGNAGAFGNDMSEMVETVRAFNVDKGEFLTLSNKDCKFGYRTSIFKQQKNMLVWDLILKLKTATPTEISQRMENNIGHRERSHPRLPSAGSIFKNLFLKDIAKHNKKLADLLLEENKVRGGKVGSGTLIDMLGLKGKVVGGAKISLEHANFIVNTGTARAQDIFQLMLYVKKEVKQRLKIELEPEVLFVGFKEYENP